MRHLTTLGRQAIEAMGGVLKKTVVLQKRPKKSQKSESASTVDGPAATADLEEASLSSPLRDP